MDGYRVRMTHGLALAITVAVCVIAAVVLLRLLLGR